jgi:hypothetical protein
MPFHVETHFNGRLVNAEAYLTHLQAAAACAAADLRQDAYLAHLADRQEARLRASVLDVDPADDALPDLRVPDTYTYTVAPCAADPRCTACHEAGLDPRAPERAHWSWEDCQERYPRLVRAVQWVLIGSASEAACCLRDYRDGFTYGSEAVSHSGLSPRDRVEQAVRQRAWARTCMGGRLAP